MNKFMSKTKLFCLPYAGGSSTIYMRWKQHMGSGIELRPIELSGRGRRYGEPLYDDINEMVEDVYGQIKEEIDSCDYAFFGHSLGSIVAYELAHKIQKNNDKLPTHIFFSGKKAPHCCEKDEKIHELPDGEFAKKILDMGGTPKEILENKELFELFLPILKADFKVNETYRYSEKDVPLDTSITVINGRQEDMSVEEIMGWRRHTAKACKLFMLDGDHFFINDKYKDIINIISSTLI